MQNININITLPPFSNFFHTKFHGKYTLSTPILRHLTKQNTIYILYLVHYL